MYLSAVYPCDIQGLYSGNSYVQIMISKKLFVEVLDKKLEKYPPQFREQLRKEMMVEFESFRVELCKSSQFKHESF
jgi:hypothetical protein